MIIQDSPDQSVELAQAISKALNTNKQEAMLALLSPKMSKAKVKQLIQAMEKGKIVAFDIIEMHGKIKIPRYECVIDFTKNEVHVIMKNNHHEYGVHDFKVVE